ncbi:MAG: prenyltransferase [Firmicutes bacterium]|nr:prenyltransferase [Clostridiales bacterium]MBQ9931010.1 prenyltransferase [Bacillota bacterium]
MYQKLTPKAVKELAAPHTWPAGIFPVLLSGVFCFFVFDAFRPVIFILALCISILLQSSVNTLNDYFDFVKGNDTEENFDDETDASIIYNRLNPKTALLVGLVFFGLALIGGIVLIWQCGWPLLVIAIVAALAIFFYSGGPKPISYLPFGELVSGVVMGGFLPLAVVYALTGQLYWMIFLHMLPLILIIAMIMLTNNTCDIERDIVAGRRTLPVLTGAKIASGFLFGGFALSMVLLLVMTVTLYPLMFWIPVIMMIHSIPRMKVIRSVAPGQTNRRILMQNSLKLVIHISVYYLIAHIAGGIFLG